MGAVTEFPDRAKTGAKTDWRGKPDTTPADVLKIRPSVQLPVLRGSTELVAVAEGNATQQQLRAVMKKRGNPRKLSRQAQTQLPDVILFAKEGGPPEATEVSTAELFFRDMPMFRLDQ